MTKCSRRPSIPPRRIARWAGHGLRCQAPDSGIQPRLHLRIGCRGTGGGLRERGRSRHGVPHHVGHARTAQGGHDAAGGWALGDSSQHVMLPGHAWHPSYHPAAGGRRGWPSFKTKLAKHRLDGLDATWDDGGRSGQAGSRRRLDGLHGGACRISVACCCRTWLEGALRDVLPLSWPAAGHQKRRCSEFSPLQRGADNIGVKGLPGVSCEGSCRFVLPPTAITCCPREPRRSRGTLQT